MDSCGSRGNVAGALDLLDEHVPARYWLVARPIWSGEVNRTNATRAHRLTAPRRLAPCVGRSTARGTSCREHARRYSAETSPDGPSGAHCRRTRPRWRKPDPTTRLSSGTRLAQLRTAKQWVAMTGRCSQMRERWHPGKGQGSPRQRQGGRAQQQHRYGQAGSDGAAAGTSS